MTSYISMTSIYIRRVTAYYIVTSWGVSPTSATEVTEHRTEVSLYKFLLDTAPLHLKVGVAYVTWRLQLLAYDWT